MSKSNANNSSNTYAGAVKKQNASTGVSSSSVATQVSTVSKRKRESSSSSSSSSDSSISSSSSSRPVSSAIRELSKFKHNVEIVLSDIESPEGLNEIIKCSVSRKKYINSVCNKFIRDATNPPVSVTTQTETDDALIEACILENNLLKAIEEKASISLRLKEEQKKVADFAAVLSRILDISVSGLSSAQDNTVIHEQRHSFQLSAFIDIKPHTQVFDEEFWGPMKELHAKWDKQSVVNKLASDNLKSTINSIVGTCRDLVNEQNSSVSNALDSLVHKSNKIRQSINDNRSTVSKSKEAKRSQSAKLCNSPPNRLSLNQVQYVNDTRKQYDNRYLKARKVRFSRFNNDSPTKTFIEQESNESMIEIEIPNVKISVPFKNQSLSEKFEFSAEFPNLHEIVNDKVKKFRETHESFDLENFDVSKEESDDQEFWEALCKKENMEDN